MNLYDDFLSRRTRKNSWAKMLLYYVLWLRKVYLPCYYLNLSEILSRDEQFRQCNSLTSERDWMLWGLTFYMTNDVMRVLMLSSCSPQSFQLFYNSSETCRAVGFSFDNVVWNHYILLLHCLFGVTRLDYRLLILSLAVTVVIFGGLVAMAIIAWYISNV